VLFICLPQTHISNISINVIIYLSNIWNEQGRCDDVADRQKAIGYRTKQNRQFIYYRIYNFWNCRMRIRNRQRLCAFYCLLPFILTFWPGLILTKTSDDSLLACRIDVWQVITFIACDFIWDYNFVIAKF